MDWQIERGLVLRSVLVSKLVEIYQMLCSYIITVSHFSLQLLYEYSKIHKNSSFFFGHILTVVY